MSDDILQPGQFIAGKRIVRLLGTGGMSQVYEVESGFHGGHVAVKMLLPRYAMRDDFAARFRAEAKFYAVLAHPNIVRMYDADQEPNGRVYIVMELLRGFTLRQLLTRHGSLKWVHALHLMNQGADAMTFAHSKGILHRDLKPENLMVSTVPENKGHLSVLDFGIAKFTDHRVDTSELPQMGTARYMSPEQVKSLWKEHKGIQIDGRADIYSFGAIFYETIAGKHIFIDDRDPPSVEAILHGHLAGEVAPLQDLAPACPDAIAAIIEKCIEKDRERRYQTMDELWDDLTAFRVSIPAEHPLAKQVAAAKRRVARKRAFASEPALLEDEAERPRMTAPMPEAFVPPAAVLPFAASALPQALPGPEEPAQREPGDEHDSRAIEPEAPPAPAPPRQLLGRGYTMRMGTAPAAQPSSSSSPRAPEPSRQLLGRGHTMRMGTAPAIQRSAPSTQSPMWRPQTLAAPSTGAPSALPRGADPELDEGSKGTTPMSYAVDEATSGPHSQIMPHLPGALPRSLPAASSPRPPPQRDQGEQRAAAQCPPERRKAALPVYVIGPAAGLSIAVAGALCVLLFLKPPRARQATEQSRVEASAIASPTPPPSAEPIMVAAVVSSSSTASASAEPAADAPTAQASAESAPIAVAPTQTVKALPSAPKAAPIARGPARPASSAPARKTYSPLFEPEPTPRKKKVN